MMKLSVCVRVHVCVCVCVCVCCRINLWCSANFLKFNNGKVEPVSTRLGTTSLHLSRVR